MKKIILTISLILASAASHAELTPLEVIKKSAHVLSELNEKKQIDSSYITDVYLIFVWSGPEGYQTDLFAAAAWRTNRLYFGFDSQAQFTGFSQALIRPRLATPRLSKADAAEFIEKGAEAILEHLDENPEFLSLAKNVLAMGIFKEDSGIFVRISTTDKQVYDIHMNEDAKILSQGFFKQ